MQKTPILVLAHARPHLIETLLASQLFENRDIYFHVDGPRTAKEIHSVNEVMKKIQKFAKIHDNVKVFAQKNNLGVRRGPEFGIDWIFEFEEQAIIIEDDIVITDDFLNYCDFYLDYFKFDFSVWQISGWTPMLNNPEREITSYLSIYTHIWGWATWKNRWERNDRDFKFWKPECLKKSKNIGGNDWASNFVNYWDRQIIQVLDGKQAWDTSWMYSMNLYDAHSVTPTQRLSGNQGFGKGANNTEGTTQIEFTQLPSKVVSNINFHFSPRLNNNFNAFHNQVIFGISTDNQSDVKRISYFFNNIVIRKIKKLLPIRAKIVLKSLWVSTRGVGGNLKR